MRQKIAKLAKSYRENGLPRTLTKAIDYALVHLHRRTIWRHNLRSLHSMFGKKSRAEIFSYIHQKRIWLSRESISGFGSTLRDTEQTRRHLKVIIAEFGIRSIYDAPCGDFNWMQFVVRDTDVQYSGADIVADLIKRNCALYRSQRNSFVVRDIVTDPFPSADLWVCRDCFMHLSFHDIFHALENFAHSKCRYLLVDNFISAGMFVNQDIDTGHWRNIDLLSAPFHFPSEARYRFTEYNEPKPAKEMFLLSREDVAAFLPRMRERIVLGNFTKAPVK